MAVQKVAQAKRVVERQPGRLRRNAAEQGEFAARQEHPAPEQPGLLAKARRGVAFGVVTGIIALGIHSTVDFNLLQLAKSEFASRSDVIFVLAAVRIRVRRCKRDSSSLRLLNWTVMHAVE